jgi:long-chain acyl-CoA synthetase
MTPPAFPATIAALPFFVAGRYQKSDLVGRCAGDRIEATSGRELVDRVRDLSLGLSALGMERGHHVALLSESRPEWLIADFAILTAGAVTIPIYPTLSAEQVRFILADSGATLAVVSSPVQLEKVLAAAPELPALRTVVLMDPIARPATAAVPVVAMYQVAADGHKRIVDGWGVAREYQEHARAVGPGDLATIIYTSGTTGTPKGVMLTHGNLASNVAGVVAVLDLTEDDTALSFLPLCHAFERTVAYVCLASGVSLIFAESIDTIARDLVTVRPTVMSAVPRVFEKLHARVLEKGAQTTGLRRKIFDWSMALAERRGALVAAGGNLPWVLRPAAAFADRQVYARIRENIGGRLRWAVSGSAPLNTAIARFFFGIGLPILEGYGLTETAPVLTVTPPGKVRLGAVGPPLPNVELRLADDGEVLARGPNLMQGYFRRPDDTRAVIVDGWFHTGDVGSLDDQGYLRITDRKKELLVTSGGKKIAPQPIEERLRAHPLVNEAMLVGDRRHFPAALIMPNFRTLAARLSLDEPSARARTEAEDVRALYQRIVDEVNVHLAQFERIKKFVLVAEEFSVQTGELTPTLKIKRRVVVEKYRAVIEAIYE